MTSGSAAHLADDPGNAQFQRHPDPPFGTAAACAIAAVLTLAVVGSSVYYLVAERRALGLLGFPLDDAWIHLQIARNLASGHGFSFNAGVTTAGATAPLWSLLLALPAFIGVPPIAGANALGMLFAVLAALAAAGLTWEASRSRLGALVAGLAVALSPRMVWGAMSGMEVPLYSALVPLALWAYVRAWDRGGTSWAWLAALAGTARPEAFVLVPLLFAHRAVAGWKSGPSWRPLRALAGVLAVVVPYIALNLRGGGSPLPTTFFAKSYGTGLLNGVMESHLAEIARGLSTYPLSALNTLLLFCQGQSALFFMAWLVGALALIGLAFQRPGIPRGAGAILLVFLVSPLAVGAIAPQPPLLVHDGRYIGHLVVLFFVIGATGLGVLHRQVSRRWFVPMFAALAIARVLSQDLQAVDRFTAMVANINQLQVAMGDWVATHTRADARVATNDIGAIAFVSGRFILDTEGLVTPDAIPYKRQRRLLNFLEQARPDVLIIFPEWYPELSGRQDLFREVHRISVAKRVVSGGATLVVYRTPWTRPGALAIE